MPIGEVGFFPGKLIHTNEIMVLLGDNWFAERSAKQASGIVDRRIKCESANIVINLVSAANVTKKGGRGKRWVPHIGLHMG